MENWFFKDYLTNSVELTVAKIFNTRGSSVILKYVLRIKHKNILLHFQKIHIYSHHYGN